MLFGCGSAALRYQLRSPIDRFTHDNERGPASLEELVDKEVEGQ